jgi:hypothetical protein
MAEPVAEGQVFIAPMGADPRDARSWTAVGRTTTLEFTLDHVNPELLHIMTGGLAGRPRCEPALAARIPRVRPLDPDAVRLSTDGLLNVHHPAVCRGQGCIVHHPSAHHMNRWPITWRGSGRLCERTCEHGIGHPDPDDVDHAYRVVERLHGRVTDYRERMADANALTVHGCDGCCRPTKKEDL